MGERQKSGRRYSELPEKAIFRGLRRSVRISRPVIRAFGTRGIAGGLDGQACRQVWCAYAFHSQLIRESLAINSRIPVVYSQRACEATFVLPISELNRTNLHLHLSSSSPQTDCQLSAVSCRLPAPPARQFKRSTGYEIQIQIGR